MKIGIFIEPKYESLNIIKFWKKIIKKNFKFQKYLDHPPHLTLAFFDFKKKINTTDLKNLFKNFQFNKIIIKILKPSIFYNDPITKADTLHFIVKKKNKLTNLQKNILIKFIKYRKIIKRNKKLKNRKFIINMKKYGYPFVDNEWLPHFTIASIKGGIKKKKIIFDKFLKQKMSKKLLKINNFSVWQIKKEKHIKLFKVSLK